MSRVAEQLHTALEEDLPSGWSLATIKDLVGADGLFVDGDWVESKDQDPSGDVRLIQLADIGDGEYRNKSDRFLTHEKAVELRCSFLMRGDVLIARMPDPLGRACIFPGDSKKSVTVVDIAIVRSGNGEFNHRWLMYFINAPVFRNSMASLQSGSTRKRISRGNLARLALPVPPREQQNRIVAEIEKQFSRLDEAVANLKRLKANLKRYKASVLKAAVEGNLTEDWRKQHPAMEPASKLLERILQDRRVEWTGRGKYQEPAEPDTSTLPSLPDGWSWAAVDQLCDFITKGTTPIAEKLREVAGDVPFLKVYNLTFTGRLDFTIKPTFVDRAVHECELVRSKVKMGDVLINIVGPPLGQVSIVPDSLVEANINQAIARFRVLGSMSNHYVAAGLMSESIMGWAIKRAKTTVGQSNLTLELCRALPFPVPPLDEQKAIVLEVERRLSVIDALEAAVEANLTRADRLRQSILSNAFAGKLVCANISQSGERSADIQMAKSLE